MSIQRKPTATFWVLRQPSQEFRKKSTCNQEHFWRWCLLHLSMYVSPPHLYTPKSKSIKYLQHSSLKYCNIRSFVFCYFISYTEAEKQQNGTERCLLHRLLSRSPFFTFRSKRKIFKINDSNSMNLTFHSSLYESNRSSSKLNCQDELTSLESWRWKIVSSTALAPARKWWVKQYFFFWSQHRHRTTVKSCKTVRVTFGMMVIYIHLEMKRMMIVPIIYRLVQFWLVM